MKIDDRINVPDASAFISRKLANFDTSRLDWFKLLPLPKRPLHSMCDFSNYAHGYRICCSVNPNLILPRTEETHVAGICDYESVTFESLNDVVVWLAGHESFYFLRHSRQIPGRDFSVATVNRFGEVWLNSEPSADRFANGWLKEFKSDSQLRSTI